MMNKYPSAINAIAYGSAHEPQSRAIAEKMVYKMHLRSAKGRKVEGGIPAWNDAMVFDVQFDDKIPMQNDNDYQMAIESVAFYHSTNAPIMIHVIDIRAMNTYDAVNNARSDVLSITNASGFHQYITDDMCATPCGNLNIFTMRKIAIHMRKMDGTPFGVNDLGSGLGEWAMTLVMFPKKTCGCHA